MMRVSRVIIIEWPEDLRVIFDDCRRSSMLVNWKLLRDVHRFAAAVQANFDGAPLECPGRRVFGGWFSAAVEYDQKRWEAELARVLARAQPRPAWPNRLRRWWRRLRARRDARVLMRG